MSLPRYPEYKDSGVDWIEEIPRHWEVRRLNTFCDFMAGKAHEPFVADDGEFVCVTARFVSTRGNASKRCTHNLSPARPRDILMVMSDLPNGRALARAYFVKEGEYLAVNQRVCAISVRDGLPEYFYFQLDRHPQLMSFDDGVEQTHLSNGSFQRLALLFPSTYEQTAIATFLDRETGKIDALIAEQEKLLALLAEKRQATISHAVTKGLNPEVPMKDSGAAWLGEVPVHWCVSPLKYLVTFSSGGTPSKENLDYWDGDIPWASAKDLKVETLHDTADHVTHLAVDNRAASLLPAGTVLVVVRGMILARIFPVTQIAVPMAINQDLKGVQPTDAVDSNYLAWLLRGSADESLQRLDEAGHGTKALRMDAWSSMQLPVPPRDEQIEIASFLDAETAKLDALKDESERAIALLKERRSALIAAAVTGQIDVRQA